MIRIGVSKVKDWGFVALFVFMDWRRGFGVDTSILASWLAYAHDTTSLLLIWLPKGGRPSYRG